MAEYKVIIERDGEVIHTQDIDADAVIDLVTAYSSDGVEEKKAPPKSEHKVINVRRLEDAPPNARGTRKRVDDDVLDKIRAMREAGNTLAEIKSKLGVSVATIYRAVGDSKKKYKTQ